jgi:hypothetical protein
LQTMFSGGIKQNQQNAKDVSFQSYFTVHCWCLNQRLQMDVPRIECAVSCVSNLSETRMSMNRWFWQILNTIGFDLFQSLSHKRNRAFAKFQLLRND